MQHDHVLKKLNFDPLTPVLKKFNIDLLNPRIGLWEGVGCGASGGKNICYRVAAFNSILTPMGGGSADKIFATMLLNSLFHLICSAT